VPCIAPSEFLTPALTVQIGLAAETIIELDYLKDVKRASFFPVSKKDFADFSHGFGNSQLYIAFLWANHPSLKIEDLIVLSLGGDLKIPDIMTNDPGRRTEFYEIKPNSIDGRAAGRVKVANIAAAVAFTGLPYVPGIQYTPNKKLKFFSGLVFGRRLEVFFHFQHISPGLIVYELCVEGDMSGLALAVILAFAAAAVVAALEEAEALLAAGVLVLA